MTGGVRMVFFLHRVSHFQFHLSEDNLPVIIRIQILKNFTGICQHFAPAQKSIFIFIQTFETAHLHRGAPLFPLKIYVFILRGFHSCNILKFCG